MWGGERGGEARAQETIVGSGEERGGAQAEVGDAVAEAFRQPLDQAMQAQAGGGAGS